MYKLIAITLVSASITACGCSMATAQDQGTTFYVDGKPVQGQGSDITNARYDAISYTVSVDQSVYKQALSDNGYRASICDDATLTACHYSVVKVLRDGMHINIQ